MIYLGADHGGFALKEQLKAWLTSWGIDYTDVGAFQLDPADDYPDFAIAVTQAVAADPVHHKGILACRSAAGVVIVANKGKGVRSVAPLTVEAAQHSREHNDANVLGLSGDWLTNDQAQAITKTWLQTQFPNEERHRRRLEKISQFEQTLWLKFGQLF